MIFAYFRLAWAKTSRDDVQDRSSTLHHLRDFTTQLAHDIGVTRRDHDGALQLPDEKMFGDYTKLLAKCHVELGQWQTAILESDFTVSRS